MRLEIILSTVAAVVSAQGVTQYLAPKGKAPKGCQTDLTGRYELSVAPLAKKEKRMAFEVGKTLQVTLKGGVLTDALSRTGYIADNYQFQFDGPPQAGSIYTGGWSLCNNGSLALGPSTVFYQCLSGSFYNLYDRWWAQQCSPINIVAHSLPEGAAAPALTASPDPLQSGSPDLPAGLASPSSPAKATSDAIGDVGSVTLTNGAAPGATTTGLSASVSALSSLDSSLSRASSVSSSVSSSAASSLSSVSSSIRSSASSVRSSASASASASNNGVQVGGTGASTIALMMGVIGMLLA